MNLVKISLFYETYKYFNGIKDTSLHEPDRRMISVDLEESIMSISQISMPSLAPSPN